MRLFPRLLLGHLGPIIAMTAALVLTLTALLEMTSVLQALNDSELKTLREESILHRDCWAVDVAMRHAEMSCKAHGDDAAALGELREPTRVLRAYLQESQVGGEMRPIARSWLDVANAVTAGPACAVLTDSGIQRRREALDEGLDKFWASRLDELRAGVERKDRQAKRIGDSALTLGFGLAAAAIALALWLAHRLATNVTAPLGQLAALTRRVGRGDFTQSIEIRGPIEIIELASDLEHMRQQLGELELLKQGFVASVSHELRTPLTKLRQALGLLRDGVVGDLNPEQQRVVRIANEACEREIRMVTTLLDLSRLRAGNPVQLRSGCRIDEIVESAVEDERSEAEARSVEIAIELQDAPRPCRVDPVLLERAIANLVRNAVSVSSPGQRVTVRRSHASTAEGPGVLISVIDQGPGVPADIRRTVFEAFVTRAVPRSPKALGVGLGLALSREIACAHGGDLRLDETTTQGATFHLWLPVAASDETDDADNPRAVA